MFFSCLGLILARGGSKGIPLKNLSQVGGVSLLERSVTAMKVKLFGSRLIKRRMGIIPCFALGTLIMPIPFIYQEYGTGEVFFTYF